MRPGVMSLVSLTFTCAGWCLMAGVNIVITGHKTMISDHTSATNTVRD